MQYLPIPLPYPAGGHGDGVSPRSGLIIIAMLIAITCFITAFMWEDLQNRPIDDADIITDANIQSFLLTAPNTDEYDYEEIHREIRF